jgi:hypothetical protein
MMHGQTQINFTRYVFSLYVTCEADSVTGTKVHNVLQVELSSLLGYDAVSLGKEHPTF